jgi:aspartate dehydrogenase
MIRPNKVLKIGIAGCGAIGSSLSKTIVSDFKGKAVLAGVYDISPQKTSALAGKLRDNRLAAGTLDELIKRSDLVVEASSARASSEIARRALLSSRDVLIMSVGGIVDSWRELSGLAARKKAKIFIPSGAIAGMDGLKASACAGIKKVVLTTKKPPLAFAGVDYLKNKKIRLDKIRKDTVVFSGKASQAVKAFPQNINVAATLSIAGIGAEKTIVRMVASPGLKRNVHEVQIDSEAGRIFTRTENLIHPDNPKTSYLAVLSAVAVLKGLLGPLKAGA